MIKLDFRFFTSLCGEVFEFLNVFFYYEPGEAWEQDGVMLFLNNKHLKSYGRIIKEHTVFFSKYL